MAPWTLNTDYDRPISRRILDEAGVLRKDFGQIKRGSDLLLNIPGIVPDEELRQKQGLGAPFTEQSLSEFFEFCRMRSPRGEADLGSTTPARQRTLLQCWGLARIRGRYAVG